MQNITYQSQPSRFNLHAALNLFKCDSFVLINFIALRIKNRYSLFFIYKMNHLNKPNLISICKILIKQNNDEDKKLKKFKQTNGNIKNYNGIFKEKIQDENHNEKLEDVNEKINMIESIKMMKINIEDEDYKKIYDCEEDDEIQNGKDDKEEIQL